MLSRLCGAAGTGQAAVWFALTEPVRITRLIATAAGAPIIIRAITPGLTSIDPIRITRSHIMGPHMLRHRIIRGYAITGHTTKISFILNTIGPTASTRGRYM